MKSLAISLLLDQERRRGKLVIGLVLHGMVVMMELASSASVASISTASISRSTALLAMGDVSVSSTYSSI